MLNLVYIVFVVLTFYFALRYDHIEEYDSHKEHRMWLMCVYLILMSGLSWGIGGDKFTYMREFETYPETLNEAVDFIWYMVMLRGQMPLWTLVNVLCKGLFHSFYALQLVQSAAINISVCYVMSKYTHRYFTFLLVYFLSLQYFIFNTEIMREGLAMSFVLVAIHSWMCGRKWLYFILIPLAMGFHISAVMALLFPFVNFRVNWTRMIIVFCIAFAIWLLSDLLLGRIMNMAMGGMGIMVQKVMFYSLHASTIFGFLRSAITYMILPFVVMYTATMYETDEDRRRRKERLTAYMLVLAIPASALAGFARLYNYVELFYLMLLADFVYITLKNREQIIMRSATLAGTAFLILLLYMIHYKSTNKYFYEFYYPYTCILDETKDVYVREMTHYESANIEEQDNNVRKLE